MITLRFFLIGFFCCILYLEGLGQISETFKPEIEDSITADNIVKIFPVKKDIFLYQSVKYFEENSVNDSTYKNGYFSIYDLSFYVNKYGRTSQCRFSGNASTDLTILRKKIMMGYCKNIIDNFPINWLKN
jgi:hypothetical protein